jgi:hypothetical protein
MAAHGRWLGAALVLGAMASHDEARARTDPAPDAGTGVIAAYVKGPFLQALGATGVTIKLEISTPAPARVEIYAAGGSAAPVAAASSDAAQLFHAVRVDGLLPATAYEYVVSAGGALSGRGRFTTAPDDARPFRFLAYGDSRNDAQAHAAVVRAMDAVPADFLINTGDLVASGAEESDWRTFFAVEGAMLRDRCVFAAVGNHELSRNDPASGGAFLRYFAPREEGHEVARLYGSFRWSNTRFFLLNAMDAWTGDERAWLRAELDRALVEPGLAHRIAVMHWGPYSAGPHGNNPALASGDVIALMRDRKVDLVLAGHDHVYERGLGGGLKYVITGGAGAPLYAKKRDLRETLVFEPAYHFVDLTVTGDRVDLVARRASGGIIEACGYTGLEPWSCEGTKAPTEAAPPSGKPDPALAAPAGPVRARNGCGCALVGAADERTGAGVAAPLAIAAAAWRRRRRGDR